MKHLQLFIEMMKKQQNIMDISFQMMVPFMWNRYHRSTFIRMVEELWKEKQSRKYIIMKNW